jgi:hypothetical protein
LAARARHPRQPKTAQLEPHREELLRLRSDGDSVEVLAIALRGLGVEISAEALRLWLNRHLPRKRAKHAKTPRALVSQEPLPVPSQIGSVVIALNVAAAANEAASSAAVPVTPPAGAAAAAAPRTSGGNDVPTSSPSAPPARPYTPWQNNFTPLVIGGRPRDPRIARDDL